MDWPDWRQSIESAEWVKNHRPAPNPLCFSQGGAWGWKPDWVLSVRFSAQHGKNQGLSWCFLFLLSVFFCYRDAVRKCCFSAPLDSDRCDKKLRVLDSPFFFLSCSVSQKSRGKKHACGSARDGQGVGQPLEQKSRCRSLPKNSKILMFWPTNRLQMCSV